MARRTGWSAFLSSIIGDLLLFIYQVHGLDFLFDFGQVLSLDAAYQVYVVLYRRPQDTPALIGRSGTHTPELGQVCMVSRSETFFLGRRLAVDPELQIRRGVVFSAAHPCCDVLLQGSCYDRGVFLSYSP